MKEKKLSKFDHRELNKILEIFFIDEKIGQGLPVLLKNGTIIKNLIQNFIRKKESEYGCEEISSPVLADPSLYQKSGHLSHYKDYIFPEIRKDLEKFQLRPMTCPHHCIVYGRKIHSYKELPVWLCEHSILHRFEPSGSLKGLERVRWMELSDNHIFIAERQLKDIFKKCFKFVSEILEKFEIKIEKFVCSLHNEKKDKYHNDEELWYKSEKSLIEALEELEISFVKMKGEAAFYGPKLDIEVKTSDGKNITISTIQIDFVLPKKFDLNYINENGIKENPIIIHYSAIGTYQRFISILIEQFEGRLPFWLLPIQLVIFPLQNKKKEKEIINFCENLLIDLKLINIRAEIWKEKRLGYRIKKIHNLKIPYYVVVGEKELQCEFLNLFHTYTSEIFKLTRLELINRFKKTNNSF